MHVYRRLHVHSVEHGWTNNTTQTPTQNTVMDTHSVYIYIDRTKRVTASYNQSRNAGIVRVLIYKYNIYKQYSKYIYLI